MGQLEFSTVGALPMVSVYSGCPKDHRIARIVVRACDNRRPSLVQAEVGVREHGFHWQSHPLCGLFAVLIRTTLLVPSSHLSLRAVYSLSHSPNLTYNSL
jgi:hypothetical protein